MTAHRRDSAHWTSNGFALLLTLGLLMVIRLTTRPESLWNSPIAPAARPQPSIEVSLQQTVVDNPPVRHPPPNPRSVPELRPAPRQAVAKTASPAAVQPLTAEGPIPDDGAPVAAVEAPQSAASAADARPDLEAQYAAGLRADIDRRTHPPDSVQYRLRRPSGEVRVGFIVLRNGETKATRVLKSSGSSILDEAAIAIVSSGHYPPMSAKLFTGEAEHIFSVTIEFRTSS